MSQTPDELRVPNAATAPPWHHLLEEKTTMFNRTLIAVLLLATGAGLAQAQAQPWHLPSTVTFPAYCDQIINVTYTPPATGQNWGWYTGTYVGSGCGLPAPNSAPVSGPEAKKLLGFNGKGAALTADLTDLYGLVVIFVLNSNHTAELWDIHGTQLNSIAWSLVPSPPEAHAPSLLNAGPGH